MEAVYGFCLFINDQRVPNPFATREEAEEAARPHLASRAALRIESTRERVPAHNVRTWNYHYDIANWMQ
jgi:hypothetical protein